MKVEVHSCRNN